MKEIKATVRVDREKAIKELPDLLEEIDELSELVPEWNKFEADKLKDNIFKRLQGHIYVDQK